MEAVGERRPEPGAGVRPCPGQPCGNERALLTTAPGHSRAANPETGRPGCVLVRGSRPDHLPGRAPHCGEPEPVGEPNRTKEGPAAGDEQGAAATLRPGDGRQAAPGPRRGRQRQDLGTGPLAPKNSAEA